MRLAPRFAAILVLSWLCSRAIPAQQAPTTSGSAPGMTLDVVVTPKNGAPVAGLEQQDFTILDNKVPQTIDSFRALRGRDAQLQAIIVVDDVNTNFDRVAFERSEIDKFLRADGGNLAFPTALAVLTDAGLQTPGSFSSDGHALAAALDQVHVPLHTVLKSGGVYSAVERFELSLKALYQLASEQAKTPGRKIVLWVSPGWPLLSGPGVEEQMDDRQRQQIYDNVVSLSSFLRLARITLYSVDPLGTADFAGRAFYWQAFTKGISKPGQADYGDIALQVLAVQSGGLAFNTSNDVAGELRKCVADAQTYYEISFVPSADQKPATFHQVEVKVAKPGLTARARQGYYAQP